MALIDMKSGSERVALRVVERARTSGAVTPAAWLSS